MFSPVLFVLVLAPGALPSVGHQPATNIYKSTHRPPAATNLHKNATLNIWKSVSQSSEKSRKCEMEIYLKQYLENFSITVAYAYCFLSKVLISVLSKYWWQFTGHCTNTFHLGGYQYITDHSRKCKILFHTVDNLIFCMLNVFDQKTCCSRWL